MEGRSNIYFASDFHLGVPDHASSREREDLVVKWLREIAPTAKEIYLLGDVFDFWYEYKSVVPKGYVRLLGCLAHLVDQGVVVKVFTGNHDIWMFDYLEEEIGVQIFREPIVEEVNGVKLFIGHGDGLGPGDNSFKLLKKLFTNKACQWMFARLHPNFSFSLANFWSGKSRIRNIKKEEGFKGNEREWLYLFCEEQLAKAHYDYFIFGHRHLPLDIEMPGGKSRYINLGEWVTGNPHYAVFDGKQLRLHPYSSQ